MRRHYLWLKAGNPETFILNDEVYEIRERGYISILNRPERSILGFDHTEVGVALANAWHLPARLQECIAHHHQPDKAPTEPEVAAVVHIANSLAVLAELDSTDQYEAPAVDSVAWEITGLSHEIIPDVIEAARAELADVKSLFLM